MSARSRFALLTACALAFPLLGVPAPGSASASAAQSVRLRASTFAPRATGTATVTNVAAGRYRVQITIARAPAPARLHVTPRRQVYIGWTTYRAEFSPIPLTFNKRTGIYSGSRVVTMTRVTGLFITADQNSNQRAPTAPEVAVLTASVTP